ncbi:hypothetical protein ABFV99_13310 [Cytobacillus horneckiae]|uniref:hypothetical protein n=1 Tax=Cytobacillus horneckiae TaxID=549687 RepID=UPI0034CDA9BA
MPNWCVGTMKVRGTKENIIRFMKEGLSPVGWLGGDLEKEEIAEIYGFTIKAPKEAHGFHVKGTRRNFIEADTIDFEYWDEDNESYVLIIDEYKAAWGIESAPLAVLSKEFDLDFRIYAFERGMEFNQEIEVIKGEVTKNNEIKFDDYEWECISPSIGG